LPFAGYKDFADCVAKNKSKSNPKAYCATIMRKVEGKKEYKISEKFGKVDLKENKGEYISKGYVATTHIDSVGDKVMKETLDKWGDEINSETSLKAKPVSIHHDRGDLNVAGMGSTAKVEQLDDGEYGLFVETHHNKTHPDFADTVYQIDHDFLTHYSIEYDTHDDSTTHRTQENGEWVRYIEPETELVGYGLASPRTVVNENSKIVEARYKELIKLNKTDEVKMESKEEKPAEEAPAEEPKAAEEEKPEEKPAEEEKKEETPKEEPKEEPEEKKDEAKELKEKIKKDIIAELKEKVEKKKPIIAKKEKVETKETEFKELKEYKEAVHGKKGKKAPLEVQWKEAGRLHDALIEKGVQFKGTTTHSDFETKEGKIEYKTLTTDANYAGAQTTYWDALDNYEQTPAELNDVYGPVIINQMNDEVATWNLIKKDNVSGDSAIRFRARTAANATAGSYAYGSTPGWDSYVTRRKLNVAFVTYYVEVAVEFEEIELARATGGIGNIYADEIKWSTRDLMSAINSDLLTSSTTPSESEPYTFETTIKTSGSLYGRTVTATGYTTLAADVVTDMNSAPLTLEKMRELIDGVLENGARRTDLAFICSYTQQRKFKTLIQAIQRTVPTSTRVGFEGTPELDGVPVYADKDANTDDLFLIDLAHMRIGVKKPASYVEFGLTELKRKGIIWMMCNLYCTAPSHNAWIYDLLTT
jgi:hypothetical protein